MRRKLVILAMTTLVGCSVPPSPTTPPTAEPVVMRLYSTVSTALLMQSLTNQYALENPHVSFETGTANHALLLERLQHDETIYFISSHLPGDDQLWAVPMARDGIAIFVNPDNPVTELNLEQLRQIYQGFITNWRDVGGPDLEITLISRETGADIRFEFERLVMGQRRTSPNAQVVPNGAAALRRVLEQPGGIGYASLSGIDGQVRLLRVGDVLPSLQTIADNTYPLRSTLFVIGSEQPQASLRSFITWAQSEAGQSIVGQRFVPLGR